MIKNLKMYQLCFLGDVIGRSEGCAGAITARICLAWKAFHELLPVLTY